MKCRPMFPSKSKFATDRKETSQLDATAKATSVRYASQTSSQCCVSRSSSTRIRTLWSRCTSSMRFLERYFYHCFHNNNLSSTSTTSKQCTRSGLRDLRSRTDASSNLTWSKGLPTSLTSGIWKWGKNCICTTCCHSCAMASWTSGNSSNS